MILLPIMIPALMGMVLLLTVVVAVAVVLFSATASAVVTAGSSLVAASRRKRAQARIPAVISVTSMPGAGDLQKAA